MTKNNYNLRQTKLWEDTTNALPKKISRIINDKVLNYIKNNPKSYEKLHFELKGLRSYNKFKSGNRIIYAICEECRFEGLENVNNCIDCDAIPNNTIMLFAFGNHDIYKNLKRKRKIYFK